MHIFHFLATADRINRAPLPSPEISFTAVIEDLRADNLKLTDELGKLK